MVATYAEEAQHIKEVLLLSSYLILMVVMFLFGWGVLSKSSGESFENRKVPMVVLMIFSAIGFFGVGFLLGARMLIYSAQNLF